MNLSKQSQEWFPEFFQVLSAAYADGDVITFAGKAVETEASYFKTTRSSSI